MSFTDGIAHEEHSVTFNKLGPWERAQEFLRYLPRELPAFASVTLSFWAITEILIVIVENQVDRAALAAPAAVVGAIAALFRAYRSYQAYVPNVLYGEGIKAQRLYRKRKLGWQWSIAREMLWNRVRPLDSELDRIRRGAEFVEPKRILNSEYFEWLRSRPDALGRLIHAATAQCTRDVPAVIGGAVSEDQLEDMKIQIQALADLYAKTTRFERECHAIMPPEDFAGVHEMTYGWTDSIRQGIRQFIDIVTEFGELDKATIKEITSGRRDLPSFTIKFDVPENLDQFSARLSQIDPLTLVG